MISAVLDTNVLVSGTVSPTNPPGQIIDAWREGLFELVTSKYILDEVTRTFNKKYLQQYISSQNVEDFLDLLQNESRVIPIHTKISGEATHPEDDLILATAVNSKADYLVTGDKKLLQKVGVSFRNTKLLIPAEFLKLLY